MADFQNKHWRYFVTSIQKLLCQWNQNKKKKYHFRKNALPLPFQFSIQHIWIRCNICHPSGIVIPNTHTYKKKKNARCCCSLLWSTITDSDIWSINAVNTCFHTRVLAHNTEKTMFALWKGQSDLRDGWLSLSCQIYRLYIRVEGGGYFHTVHQNPLQTVSWIMQHLRWKHSLRHFFACSTNLWRIRLSAACIMWVMSRTTNWSALLGSVYSSKALYLVFFNASQIIFYKQHRI